MCSISLEELTSSPERQLVDETSAERFNAHSHAPNLRDCPRRFHRKPSVVIDSTGPPIGSKPQVGPSSKGFGTIR